jgi:HemK-like putative methylase
MDKDEAWLLKEKYNGVADDAFQNDLGRLRDGEPLAYIIGSIPFLDTVISLDSRPLIPRAETEYWVNELIADYRSKDAVPLQILDLCAGSGCIGIALGNAFKEAHVTFAEIDPRHHSTIRKNALFNGMSPSRFTIIGGDLFEETSETFDLIVSNPPYIDKGLGRTDENVIRFEPSLALYGGQGGTEVLERILMNAQRHLIRTGLMYLEHEPEHREQLSSLAETLGLSCTTHNDQYGVYRYSIVRVAQ